MFFLTNIRAESRLDGESFEKIAQKHSQDYLNRGSCWQVFQPFELNSIRHIVNLKIGEVSGVVECSTGYVFTQLLGIENSQNRKKYKYRNIFLSFTSINTNMQSDIQLLDSLRKSIMEGKFKFENVAKTFSEDQETRYQGGMMKDQQTKANLISIQNLDSYLFLTLDTMRIGSISKPQAYRTDDGRTAVRIIYFKSKNPGHTANLTQDYPALRQMALYQKRQSAVDRWYLKTCRRMNIEIDVAYRSCNLLNNR